MKSGRLHVRVPPCRWGVTACGTLSPSPPPSPPPSCSAVLLRVILRCPVPSQWPQELESQDRTRTSLSQLGSRALLRDGPPGSHDHLWSPGPGVEVEEGTGKASVPPVTRKAQSQGKRNSLFHMDRKGVAGRSLYAGGGQGDGPGRGEEPDAGPRVFAGTPGHSRDPEVGRACSPSGCVFTDRRSDRRLPAAAGSMPHRRPQGPFL